MLKDVILGFARLADKEFRVGDFVTFNGTNSGTIEEISIRFMQIREWSGKLLTIPHGEIRTIQNFNKGWMRVIERITVSYQEDPTRVKELLEEVCVICNEKLNQTLYRVEDEAVEPFKYVGVTDLNPNLKYVGYEFCITGLIKPEDYFETSRQVRFELMSMFHKIKCKCQRRIWLLLLKVYSISMVDNLYRTTKVESFVNKNSASNIG